MDPQFLFAWNLSLAVFKGLIRRDFKNHQIGLAGVHVLAQNSYSWVSLSFECLTLIEEKNPILEVRKIPVLEFAGVSGKICVQFNTFNRFFMPYKRMDAKPSKFGCTYLST